MFRTLSLSLGLTALAALGGLWITAAPSLGPISAAQAQEVAQVAPFTLGDPGAPIKLEEFASFTCGHCGTFHDEVFKKLKAEYIDTGKVHFTYHEVYWDPYAIWAGLLARCGGETRFFGIVSMLYEKQRDWIDPKDPQKTAGNLRQIGRTAGLADDQMEACLSDAALATALRDHSAETTAKAGVTGTPALVIDGQLYKNMRYRDLKKILDEKLAG
ncbi:thioredoxin domain-containing protein [Rhodovulum euryhalinum]|uniref:Thioredoxin-like protein n=1 Tax=Rhodovulum euryhalinum TaxID=35805 RepID=A0A4R2KQR1_9RHOB|nr:thioredoxin domain-containing protein [Rhodovulum euryhalinum]TCO73286.1 thioredoxin-like protein [Rhodovulum euryhalinum]